MDKKEFRRLVKDGGHKFSYCSLCKMPIILCGKCGNNTCNPSSGIKKCVDECCEAHTLWQNHFSYHPYRFRIRFWFDSKIYRKLLWLKVQFLDIKYIVIGK